MERRVVLAGAAASAAALLPGAASAADTTTVSPASPDLAAALARFRASIPAHFDRTYVENAIVPFFLVSIYQGERPALPMIDVTLTKENALPDDLWGLIYQDWKPAPEEGVTVFLQGLEKRGHGQSPQAHLHVRCHAGSLPADVQRQGDAILRRAARRREFAGKPLMRPYLDDYWDLYWDLHLGVKGMPFRRRSADRRSFNTVLAYRDPTRRSSTTTT